ncbi:MAG: hypothetical protein ABSG91_07850 [Syntrophobacteraceae bacterium]
MISRMRFSRQITSFFEPSRSGRATPGGTVVNMPIHIEEKPGVSKRIDTITRFNPRTLA